MIRDDYTAWDECPDVDNCELIQSFLELVDSMVKDIQHLKAETVKARCFLQALFPQKCRLTSSKLHGEFPQYCISSAGTLSGAGEEPLQAYKVY